MPERGFVSYSTPIDTVLAMLERCDENGGYVRLTKTSPCCDGGCDHPDEIRIANVVDALEALATGALARDALYRAEYVPELIEED